MSTASLQPITMRQHEIDFSRLTNLADGIFGVAMTLLVFTITIPAPSRSGLDGDLLAHLATLEPNFGALALSFFISARCWVLHHRLHRVVTQGDEFLLILNLVFLAGVVVLPLSAEVLGTYPLSRFSVGVYAGNVGLLAISLSVIWVYALLVPGMIAVQVREGAIEQLALTIAMAFVFFASIALAWISPVLAVVTWFMTIPLSAGLRRLIASARTAERVGRQGEG